MTPVDLKCKRAPQTAVELSALAVPTVPLDFGHIPVKFLEDHDQKSSVLDVTFGPLPWSGAFGTASGMRAPEWEQPVMLMPILAHLREAGLVKRGDPLFYLQDFYPHGVDDPCDVARPREGFGSYALEAVLDHPLVRESRAVLVWAQTEPMRRLLLERHDFTQPEPRMPFLYRI